jgi:hypothetical protein
LLAAIEPGLAAAAAADGYTLPFAVALARDGDGKGGRRRQTV